MFCMRQNAGFADDGGGGDAMLVAHAAGHCVLRQVVCVSRKRSRTEHQDQAGVLNFTWRQALVVQMLYNSDVWSLSAEAQNEEAARSATTSAI